MSGSKNNSCHSEPEVKPGKEPAVKAAALRLLVALLSLVSTLSSHTAAQTSQDLLAAGRVDQALLTLEAQIHTTPTAEAYNLLCRAHFELGAWEAGIAACEKATTLAPDNALYHLWLGRIYGEKADRAGFLRAAGLAGKVRTEFERSVELSPNSWEARTDLAEFYLEAPGIVGGGKDRALSQAELLAPLNPAMAHWVKARVAEKNKDNVAAEKEYRAAIEASQGGARAWLNLAGFYRHLNRFDDMEQALRTMESRPIDHPAALVDAAGMLLRTGHDYPMAIRLVRRYIALSNTEEEAPVFKAHTMLGELLEKQGDRAAAAEEYRAALAMAHTFRQAQDGLKRVTRQTETLRKN
ncbi:MAG TPA: tetratricopeptide repeat protein [Candidatus Dormibacteraeota bacterium]|jgi:tetratricopeptide (TPR) repeat protein|nr:tetratricopeptide repeat protein [Candidatus Dormibacteraeota bacterium]